MVLGVLYFARGIVIYLEDTAAECDKGPLSPYGGAMLPAIHGGYAVRGTSTSQNWLRGQKAAAACRHNCAAQSLWPLCRAAKPARAAGTWPRRSAFLLAFQPCNGRPRPRLRNTESTESAANGAPPTTRGLAFSRRPLGACIMCCRGRSKRARRRAASPRPATRRSVWRAWGGCRARVEMLFSETLRLLPPLLWGGAVAQSSQYGCHDKPARARVLVEPRWATVFVPPFGNQCARVPQKYCRR